MPIDEAAILSKIELWEAHIECASRLATEIKKMFAKLEKKEKKSVYRRIRLRN